MHQSWNNFAKAYGPVVGLQGLPSNPAYTNGRNLQAVCTLAKHTKPNMVVEIGTSYGHTAVALAITCPEARVDTFDVCRETAMRSNSPFAKEILPRDQVGKVIAEQSQPIRDRIYPHVLTPILHGQSLLAASPFRRVQFAYIDGDHTWRSVVADTRAVLDRMDAGGVIVWDDYGTVREVQAFVDILNRRSGNKIVAVRDTRICYIQLAEGQREAMLDASADL